MIRLQPSHSVKKGTNYPNDPVQGPADPGKARMIWVSIRMIRLGYGGMFWLSDIARVF